MTTVTISREKYEELMAIAGKEIITKQEAQRIISNNVESLKKLVKETQEVADENGLNFYIDLTDGYAQGATYENGNWSTSSDNC
jgi:predicted peroxiredoxin